MNETSKRKLLHCGQDSEGIVASSSARTKSPSSTDTTMDVDFHESSSSSSPPPIILLSSIGKDQLFSILLLLPVESILCFAVTCKKFKSLAYSDTLWESLCNRDWGHRPPFVDALKAQGNPLRWKKVYQQVYQFESVVCRKLQLHLFTDSPHQQQQQQHLLRPNPRASHSFNLVSRCLVLFGGGCVGGRHLDDTWISYVGDDLSRRVIKWHKINSGVPSGRFGHSCVVVGDFLVLFGGINDLGIRQNDTWVGYVTFDQRPLIGSGVSLSWRLLDVGGGSEEPPPRGAHAGCCIDNRRMLIHGGIGHSGMRLGDTWILQLSEDLYSGTWTEVVARPCPPPRSGHTTTHIGGTQTILFGGRGLGYEVLNDIWLFDASSPCDVGCCRWVQVAFDLHSIPQGFSLPRVGHSANLVVGRRLLIYGGEDSYRHRKDDFWVLDIGSIIPPSSVVTAQPPRLVNDDPSRIMRKMWKRVESKGERPGCRSFHGACVDSSGRYLYVCGGMVDGLVQPADPSGLRFDGETFLVEVLEQQPQ